MLSGRDFYIPSNDIKTFNRRIKFYHQTKMLYSYSRNVYLRQYTHPKSSILFIHFRWKNPYISSSGNKKELIEQKYAFVYEYKAKQRIIL